MQLVFWFSEVSEIEKLKEQSHSFRAMRESMAARSRVQDNRKLLLLLKKKKGKKREECEDACLEMPAWRPNSRVELRVCVSVSVVNPELKLMLRKI